MRCLPVFLMLSAFCASAHADLYMWTDANGQKHFSDKPEAGQKEQIIKSEVAPAESSADRESAHDINERQKQALKHIQDERQKRAEQEQRANAQAAEDEQKCQVARAKEGMLEHGRVFTRDSSGEKHYFSDDELAAKRAEAEADIQENCH